MTIGISPKVAIPAIALLLVGAAVTIVGALVHDQLVTGAGIGVLSAALGGGALGYTSPAGALQSARVDVANDDALSLEAKQKLKMI